MDRQEEIALISDSIRLVLVRIRSLAADIATNDYTTITPNETAELARTVQYLIESRAILEMKKR